MAAVTDLTWQQLNDAVKQLLANGVNVVVTQGGEADPVYINITALLGIANLNDSGVIKAFSILLEAARRAQETANTGKATGERLSAFPAPVNGTPANNFVPVTRSMTARADLSSATKIVGTNA